MISFFKRLRWSPKNGLIIVTNRGEVLVNGHKQTSARYAHMWADALSRCPLPKISARALMLGLGGGGALPAIYNALPGCRITVIEHDLHMLEIAAELKAYEPYPAPNVIAGDALEEITKLQDPFDLIAVDIFKGVIPSPLVQNEKFWKILRARLSTGGVALLNVAASGEYLSMPKGMFSHSLTWQYDPNIFGAFWD